MHLLSDTRRSFGVPVPVLQTPPVTLTFGMCQSAEGGGECCAQKSCESIRVSECVWSEWMTVSRTREWVHGRKTKKWFLPQSAFCANGVGGVVWNMDTVEQTHRLLWGTNQPCEVYWHWPGQTFFLNKQKREINQHAIPHAETTFTSNVVSD